MNILNDELKSDLINRGFSRRNFGRIAAMITAGATLPFYNEPAMAQLSKVNAPPDAVLLNANENPLGQRIRMGNGSKPAAARCRAIP